MNRERLVATLEAVAPALATSNVVPIFQSFVFKEGYVSAYNDAIAIIGPSDWEGTAGFNGKTLLGLLKATKAEEVEIYLEEQYSLIKFGKTKSKLPFDPEENFIFTVPDAAWDAELALTQSFFESLDICLETVAKDQTQTALLGVTLEGKSMFSCDGDAVTKITMSKGIGKNRILLPTAFCEAVAKIWQTQEMTKGLLKFNDEWVFADFPGDWWVYGRVLKIDKPIDFDKEIKKVVTDEIEPQAIPEGLNEALDRALVISANHSQKTDLTVSKNKLDLHTETPHGEVADTLTFKGHPEASVSVSASHLQRALKHCERLAFYENGTYLEKVGEINHIMMFVSNM